MERAVAALPGSTRLAPVTIWALFGAACLVYTAWILVTWVTSADFAPVVPPGPHDKSIARTVFWAEVICAVLSLACLWIWVVRPRLRTGEFSLVGLMFLASLTTYIHDPLSNYYSYGIAYNSYFFNVGSWANSWFGFSYPGQGRMPEGLVTVGSTYLWFNLLFPILFAWMMKQWDRRFPQRSRLQLFGLLFVTMFVIDAVQEMFYLRFGLYSYIGASHAWSFFGGHYYQFPIFIGVFTAFFWFGFTSLIYYRDDRGQSWAERGLERYQLSKAQRTGLRFLALIGASWAISLGAYFIPVQWMYTHGDAIPSDTPPYLVNNLCGEPAGWPCPGRGVPLPRRDVDGARAWRIQPAE
jgi:hypothetical protein